MNLVIIGLGVQGRKRLAMAGAEVVATVDPTVPTATYDELEQVPLDSFEAACVCTPDQTKLGLVRYLLAHGKHVLVEKPLFAADLGSLRALIQLAQASGVACYTAYNHRFEPHIARLKTIMDSERLGTVYLVRGFYGNGTAVDIACSPWRDQGAGVLSDLGSHLLDLVLLLFGEPKGRFERWSANRFETRAFDHALFGVSGRPAFELEATFVSWRNTFTLDVYGERGSVHLDGLCKWGPSLLTVRQRVWPSGRPTEEIFRVEGPDPTWALEYDDFKRLCQAGQTNLANDLWISSVLHELAEPVHQEACSS